MDLQAYISEEIILKPGERKLIPTGLSIAIPENLEIQIRPRSGLAYKKGISVVNTPGTIDSDYRGEIKVLLINLGKEDFIIKKFERIAQMVVCPITKVVLSETNDLPDTIRGEGGFGARPLAAHARREGGWGSGVGGGLGMPTAPDHTRGPSPPLPLPHRRHPSSTTPRQPHR